MDVEVVALSPSQHATVKRLFLNVLSGDDRFLSCNRAALQEQQIPQRFLIERGWAIRGNKMTFTLSMDKARQFLQELQATNGPVPGPVAAAAPVPSEAGKAALPEVVARVKAAIQREEKRPGVWSFPCVFRFSAAEFGRMMSLGDENVTQLEAALHSFIAEGTQLLQGKLEATSQSSFMYSRT